MTALITVNIKLVPKQENALLYKGVQINDTVNNQLWLSSSKLEAVILSIWVHFSLSYKSWIFGLFPVHLLKVLAPYKTFNIFNLCVFIYTCNFYRNQLIPVSI